MSQHERKWADLAGGMLDQILCSCGWESQTYFDGREYAHAEWCRHVAASEPATPPVLAKDGPRG